MHQQLKINFDRCRRAEDKVDMEKKGVLECVYVNCANTLNVCLF